MILFVQIMFNIEKAHFIVDEMVMNGHIVESNKKNVLETVRLMESARMGSALAYIGVSNLVGILAVWGGIKLVTMLTQSPT